MTDSEKIKKVKSAYSREYCKRWRQKNRDRVNAYQRKWRSENRDKVREYQNRFYLKKYDELYGDLT